jgi:hypothetical protein
VADPASSGRREIERRSGSPERTFALARGAAFAAISVNASIS